MTFNIQNSAMYQFTLLAYSRHQISHAKINDGQINQQPKIVSAGPLCYRNINKHISYTPRVTAHYAHSMAFHSQTVEI